MHSSIGQALTAASPTEACHFCIVWHATNGIHVRNRILSTRNSGQSRVAPMCMAFQKVHGIRRGVNYLRWHLPYVLHPNTLITKTAHFLSFPGGFPSPFDGVSSRQKQSYLNLFAQVLSQSIGEVELACKICSLSGTSCSSYQHHDATRDEMEGANKPAAVLHSLRGMDPEHTREQRRWWRSHPTAIGSSFMIH